MGTPIGHGYDWAWAQISGDQVKSNGGTFVVRYLGGSARLTAQERDNLHRDGVNILLVWETAADATEGGYARGLYDGRAANDEANSLGYPADVPLLYADDQNDPDPAQEVAYKQGVNDAHGRESDLYSGGNVLVALDQAQLRTFGGWMVETWYPNVGADPFMVQLANTRSPAMAGADEGSYDTNLLYRSVPMWGPSGTVNGVLPAPILEDDMPLFQTTDAGKVSYYRDAGGILVPIDVELATRLGPYGAGMKVVDLGGPLGALAYSNATAAARKKF